MSQNQCKVTISVPGKEVYQIETTKNCSLDVNYVSEIASSNNTVYEYSGRHDHGKLPTLKSSGPMAELISSLMDAKAECDKYLTQCINDEYGGINSSDQKIDDGEV